MSILSVASVIEKNRIESDVAWVLLLEVEVVDPATGGIAEILYFANNDEDVVHQGNTYVAVKFDLTLKQESGTAPDVSITVNDFTRAIQARLQAYGGAIGSAVTIIVLNTDNADGPTEVIEFFEVVGADASEYKITWKLGAANSLATQFPKRKQAKDFCQWRYKDADTCAYTGPEASCDYTLQGDNGCAAKGHTMFFGAMPGINSNGATY